MLFKSLQLLSLITCLLPQVAMADSIRLFEESEASDSVIRLADVAELDGDYALSFATLKIASFTAGQASMDIKIDDIRTALVQGDAKLSNLSLVGRTSTRVYRDNPALAVASAEETSHRPDSQIDRAVTPSGETLSDLLTQKIAEVSGSSIQELDIQFVGRADEAAWLNRSAADSRFELRSLSRTGLGRVPITVHAYAEDGTFEKQTINAEVSRKVMAVVATASIHRGERFSANNIEIREIAITADHGPIAQDIDLLLNRVADASLREGSPIRLDQIKEEKVIQRGELVTITVVQGRLVVRTVARSKEDASLGQMLQLENEVTREKFYATATGTRTATIGDAMTATDVD